MSKYEEYRRWSDKYLVGVKMILGKYFIDISLVELDTKHATDLILRTDKGTHIAVRLRNNKYMEDFKDEFCLRYSVVSGVDTEFKKILKGNGDLLFYGWVDESIEDKHKAVVAYALVDLDTFRYHLIEHPEIKKNAQDNVKSNFDGSCLIPFRYDAFPSEPSIVVDELGIF